MAMIGKFSNYSFINTNVFSAMQSRLANRSNEALAEEERQDKSNGLTNIAALMRANNVRVSDNLNQTSDSVAVIFNDPKTNERITLNLSKENLERLKGQFDTDNFYARSDGAIRLNGKAEAFVSGWFGDIAYQQNFAEADKDKSGRVTGSEFADIKAPIVTFTYDDTTAKDVAIDQYVKGVVANDTIGATETIEEMLNAFIKIDKNFDGNIEELSELYDGDMQALVNDIDQVIIWAERNVFNKIQSTPNNSDDKKTALSSLGDIQSGNTDWKKKLEELKKLREELDEQFAKQAEKAKERLEQGNEKGEVLEVDEEIKDIDLSAKQPKAESGLESETNQTPTTDFLELDNPELSSVVDEIRSKVANNDVQLFEVQA